MSYDALIKANVSQLQSGIALIETLPGNLYFFDKDHSQMVSHSPGKHFRHILNFYQGFLADTQGRYNYDNRVRDPLIEKDPLYCCQRIQEVVLKLQNRTPSEDPVFSWCRESGDWLPSSEARELKFLLEHTIHHFALVSLILRQRDFPVPPDFGVAPSTLDYYKEI